MSYLLILFGFTPINSQNYSTRKESKTTHMEIVTFSFELGRGINLVSHDPGDGFLNILHPFGHLGVPHVVDFLDEGIVLLPERHLGNLFAFTQTC